jgi:hypothetical protein
VIGAPFNDHRCMGSISEVARELVAQGDPVIAQIASEHATTEDLAAWIRSLPQRDDLGERGDGPKVETCSPPQRLRIPASDPNCVERAALYVAAAELIDPDPVRQLATLDTPVGLHTFPIEDGDPVVLDPLVHRNCLTCGIAAWQEQEAAPLSPRDAIEWTAQLAEMGAATVRNGPSRVAAVKGSLRRLVEEGKPPATVGDVDGIAWMLSLAERVARRYGPQALAVVRSTAQAVTELAEEAIARANRANRNVSINIGGYRLRPAPWASALAKIAARTGMDVGMTALRVKLLSMGVPPSLLASVERELQAEGLDPRGPERSASSRDVTF